MVAWMGWRVLRNGWMRLLAHTMFWIVGDFVCGVGERLRL